MSFVGKWFGFGKDPNYDEGVYAYEQKNFREAIKWFKLCAGSMNEAALRERAKSYIAGSLAKLAKDAYRGRDFDTALGYLTEATDIRPEFADIWLWKAKTLAALGQVDEAQVSVEKSLEINEEFAAARLLRGILLYRSGDYIDGLREIRAAAELDPKIETADFRDGLSEHDQGDHKAALDLFKQIEPRGGDVNDLLSVGDELAKQGEWEKAADQFRHAATLAPNYADVHVRYGQALLETGRLPEAGQSFQRAIAINPDYAEAYALAGVTYRRQSDEDNAMASFRRALEIDPNHPIAGQEVLYRRR